LPRRSSEVKNLKTSLFPPASVEHQRHSIEPIGQFAHGNATGQEHHGTPPKTPSGLGATIRPTSKPKPKKKKTPAREKQPPPIIRYFPGSDLVPVVGSTRPWIQNGWRSFYCESWPGPIPPPPPLALKAVLEASTGLSRSLRLRRNVPFGFETWAGGR